MTNKLISLVIIMFILSIGRGYSDDQFIFPKEKPSIFKKVDKNSSPSSSVNLPQKKPSINHEQKQKKEVIIKNDLKTVEKKEIRKVENIQKKKFICFSTKETNNL